MSDIELVEQKLPETALVHNLEDERGGKECAEGGGEPGYAQHSASLKSQVFLESELSNKTETPIEVW